MSKDTFSPEKRAIGARIRETRNALGYTKRPDFLRAIYPGASQVEIDVLRDRLEQWERGAAYPDHDFIRAMKRWRGITFDWIDDDDMRGLPADVYNAIVRHRGSAA